MQTLWRVECRRELDRDIRVFGGPGLGAAIPRDVLGYLDRMRSWAFAEVRCFRAGQCVQRWLGTPERVRCGVALWLGGLRPLPVLPPHPS